MSIVIEPSKGVVLAKLGVSTYGDIPVPAKDYDSITWATVVSVNKNDTEEYGYLMNRVIYYRQFKDDARINYRPGEESLVLIEIKDILGSSYDTNS